MIDMQRKSLLPGDFCRSLGNDVGRLPITGVTAKACANRMTLMSVSHCARWHVPQWTYTSRHTTRTQSVLLGRAEHEKSVVPAPQATTAPACVPGS